jgi:hypothetical protein
MVTHSLLGSDSGGSRSHTHSGLTSLTAELLLALASTVILGSESHGTHDHIYCLVALGTSRTRGHKFCMTCLPYKST